MPAADMNRRTWNDAHLRDAVSGQTSWRGVARTLGLKATSAGVIRTVKRHAAQLQLDTTHFTGQRKWSDQDLSGAVAQAASWSDVLRILGLADRADCQARVKGHALRLGLDVGHLKDQVRPRPASSDLLVRAPEPSALRSAAPTIAMAWFAVRGLPVALPVEPQAYDLLVMTPDEIQRVQVKSTTCRAANGKWQVGIGRRPYSLDKTAGKTCYDPDSLDYFFLINGEGGIYLIPSLVVAGRLGIFLDAYPEYKVGDASSLLAGACGQGAEEAA